MHNYNISQKLFAMMQWLFKVSVAPNSYQTYVGDGRYKLQYIIYFLYCLWKWKYKFLQIIFGMNTSYMIHRATQYHIFE